MAPVDTSVLMKAYARNNELLRFFWAAVHGMCLCVCVCVCVCLPVRCCTRLYVWCRGVGARAGCATPRRAIHSYDKARGARPHAAPEFLPDARFRRIVEELEKSEGVAAENSAPSLLAPLRRALKFYRTLQSGNSGGGKPVGAGRAATVETVVHVRRPASAAVAAAATSGSAAGAAAAAASAAGAPPPAKVARLE
jgi:hypothetical protein